MWRICFICGYKFKCWQFFPFKSGILSSELKTCCG
jgi:hypothetical protein